MNWMWTKKRKKTQTKAKKFQQQQNQMKGKWRKNGVVFVRDEEAWFWLAESIDVLIITISIQIFCCCMFFLMCFRNRRWRH